VPSLLFDLEAILARAQFISVGTNDLMQYLFAVDRDNTRVARRFDPLSPAMLKAMQRIADAANAAGVPATVCGEMAGRPLEALALLALGFRSLSMSPASIGPVKAMLLALDAADASAFLKGRLAEASGKASLRVALQTYAEKAGIPL
jgi:phosphotransferase system enzyme I (PtsP)